jgi:hypothetical protein
MDLPANQPDEDQQFPEPSASRKNRVRKFCRVGRAFCWIAGIALVLLAVGSLIIGAIAFVSAPASENTTPQKQSSAGYDPSLVGKVVKRFHFEFGAAYEWSFPRFVFKHVSSSTVTAVDEALQSNSQRKSSETVYAIQSHNIGVALAEYANNTAYDVAEEAIKRFYPGLNHAVDTNAKGWQSRGFVLTNTLAELVSYTLGILLVIRFHRLFGHCSHFSALDRSAIAIYRQLLVIYTVILVFGPLSFYLTNLVISGGVSHVLCIPYEGALILLLLSCLYWLINKTSHLQEEVNATI